MRRLLFLALVCALILGGALLYMYRYEIFQYSAETVLLRMLPAYLKIDGAQFNLQGNEAHVRNARILNPPGFSDNPILSIESIYCKYVQRGKNLLDGIEITELRATKPVVRIERLSDGRMNVVEMKNLFTSPQKIKGEEPARKGIPKILGPLGSKKPSELLKLPDTMRLEEGRVVFVDHAISAQPRVLTFDRICSDVSLKLNEDYSKVLYLTSSGSGILNERPDETLSWIIALDPKTPKLTMANRFTVRRVDILPFQPYFSGYSPYVVKSGRFSGDLVFDFDNGNIGSMNTVWLEELDFQVKPGYENAQFLQTTVPALTNYLNSLAPGTGAIVFDFKLKGPMSKPNFYPGPIIKQTLASIAVDKTVDFISAVAQGSVSKADSQKAQEVIDVLKDFMKQK
jgi:hypothetical protein